MIPAGCTRPLLMDPGWRASSHPLSDRLLRGVWTVVWMLLFRPTPRIAHAWRALLLRLFGAKLKRGVAIHPSTRIWAPWNLRMEQGAVLGPHVDCYNCAEIALGPWAVVSQYSYLCTGSHDISSLRLTFYAEPITIGAQAWVCADVFVGPGVHIGEGAVVGARSVVFKNVPPWSVVAGNPARFLRHRLLTEDASLELAH